MDMTASSATVLAALIGASVAGAELWLVWFSGKRQRIAEFRRAVIEKRLQVHQKVYRLWHEMVSTVHDALKGPETAVRCQEWWFANCPYLDASVREEFLACAREAFLYRDLKDPDKPDETAARFNRIQRVFGLLAEGVQLPSIGEYEGRKK
jgi:hypothetical protein